MIAHRIRRPAIHALIALATVAPLTPARPTSDSPLAARPNGMKSAEPTHHVFIGATVHPEPGVVWQDGYIEIRDGVIVQAMDAATATLALPGDAVIHDLTGEHIYPAFIDPYIEVDAPAPDAPGKHWSREVTPRRSALDGGGIDPDTAADRRDLGFAAGVIAPKGGVFAGSAAVVSLAERPDDPSAEWQGVYRDNVFQCLRFKRNGWEGTYPTSVPGAVALIRQTLIDADWQARQVPTRDGSHPADALTPLEDASTPLLFDCDHELKTFLAADIASEFSRPAVLLGSGMEFKWLDGIADLGLPIIIPLRFPAKPDVSTVGKAESVELETMMTWEQAPTNPRRLREKMPDTDLALTASRLPRGRDFLDELRLAIENGLGEDDALAMLTTAPARLAGVADQLGTIENGKRANLLITSGPVFDEDTDFYDIWIDGVPHTLTDRPGPDFDGTWHFFVGPEDKPFFEMTLEITGSHDSPNVVGTETWGEEGEQEPHSAQARKVVIEDNRISFLLDDEDDQRVTYIISGVLAENGLIRGTAVGPDDNTFQWAARKTGEPEDQADEPEQKQEQEPDDDDFEQAPPLPGYPFGPYAVKYE
ncbi:MAG TPA: hypothetical protein ENK11_03265, partial [Phycisphaerales bacterium]|nr:hypothetical protein [Phycisphaerales bacterium]